MIILKRKLSLQFSHTLYERGLYKEIKLQIFKLYSH